MVAGATRRRVVHLLPDVLLGGVWRHVGRVMSSRDTPQSRGRTAVLVGRPGFCGGWGKVMAVR